MGALCRSRVNPGPSLSAASGRIVKLEVPYPLARNLHVHNVAISSQQRGAVSHRKRSRIRRRVTLSRLPTRRHLFGCYI